MSGGMRQRVMIAMAMVCGPKLLIADEPTTALDVTIQAQILSLMVALKEDTGMSLLLITHNLGVVAQMASRVVVMYAGQVVEEAPVADLFDRPFHPYTRGLLRSMPRLGSRRSGGNVAPEGDPRHRAGPDRGHQRLQVRRALSAYVRTLPGTAARSVFHRRGPAGALLAERTPRAEARDD